MRSPRKSHSQLPNALSGKYETSFFKNMSKRPYYSYELKIHFDFRPYRWKISESYKRNLLFYGSKFFKKYINLKTFLQNHFQKYNFI